MKRITQFFIYFLFIYSTFGQTVQEPPDNIYVTELIAKRTVYLNKGSATLTGGVTREVIAIQLPPKTVEWGYIISTYRNKEDLENAKNNSSVVSIIANAYDKTGIISSALSTAFPISSESFCDVRLMDEENMRIFENKDDLWGTTCSYYREGSSENFVGGKFAIKNFSSGNWYIGLRNPSTSLPVGVTFEAYAFVRKKSLEELEQEQNAQQLAEGINSLVGAFSKKDEQPKEWNTETKDNIYNWILNYGIGKNSEGAKNVSLCTMQNLTDAITLEQFNALPEAERNQIIDKQINSCLLSSNENKLSEEIKQKRYYLGMIDSLKIIDDNKHIAENYKKILLLGFTINDGIYNSIGWYCLLANDLEQARYYLKKGESLKPDDLYLKMNLAHLFLMQNKYDEAETIYVKYKNEKLNGIKFKEIVKTDFQTFDVLGILPAEASKIKKKLGI